MKHVNVIGFEKPICVDSFAIGDLCGMWHQELEYLNPKPQHYRNRKQVRGGWHDHTLLPEARLDKLREAIHNFQQEDGETFSEAWYRFSDLIRECPSHGMEPNKELHKFYKGLTYEDVRWINAASKEDLTTLSFDQVRELFESQAAAQKTWHSSRRATTKKVETFGDGIRDDEMSTIKGQIASIHTQVGALPKHLHLYKWVPPQL